MSRGTETLVEAVRDRSTGWVNEVGRHFLYLLLLEE